MYFSYCYLWISFLQITHSYQHMPQRKYINLLKWKSYKNISVKKYGVHKQRHINKMLSFYLITNQWEIKLIQDIKFQITSPYEFKSQHEYLFFLNKKKKNWITTTNVSVHERTLYYDSNLVVCYGKQINKLQTSTNRVMYIQCKIIVSTCPSLYKFVPVPLLHGLTHFCFFSFLFSQIYPI